MYYGIVLIGGQQTLFDIQNVTQEIIVLFVTPLLATRNMFVCVCVCVLDNFSVLPSFSSNYLKSRPTVLKSSLLNLAKRTDLRFFWKCFCVWSALLMP